MSHFRINCFQYVDQSNEKELARYKRINERLLINMVIVTYVNIRKKQLIQLKIDEDIQIFLFSFSYSTLNIPEQNILFSSS